MKGQDWSSNVGCLGDNAPDPHKCDGCDGGWYAAAFLLC